MALVLRAARPMGPAPMVAVALLAGWHFAGPSAVRWARGEVQAWNLFHYAIGARFFGELGYRDLYVATLAADRAGDDSLARIRTVRDLETYEKVRRDETFPLAERFPPARADELRAAVDALEPRLERASWPDVYVDRGYNATPAFTAIAGPIAEALPVEDPVRLRIATLIDPLLLACGLAAIAAACGVEGAAVVVALLAVFPGTVGRWFGGFLEYDWLAALMIGAAAIRARPAAAGIALSWAAASRLFPAALVASALLAWRDRRFAAAAAGGGLAWLLLGCLTPRGPAAWLEFVPRILHHAGAHVVGERRIGLWHLLTWAPGPSGEAIREEVLAGRAWLGWLLVAVAVLAWGRAALRSSRDEALQLGWIVVFALTVSSRYYWAGAALLALVPDARGRWLAAGLAGAFAVGHLAEAAGADRYEVYVALEAALALVLAGWALAPRR